MKKIVLAFSGGLDTTFSIPYLMEQGYQVITVTVDTGGFTKAELATIKEKSQHLGAEKHYQIDGKKQMYDQVASYIIKSNGVYQGSYPNMCADRYIIASEALKIARKEGINTIAHGSSAMGNDQVRFDVALMTLDPMITIVCPIKEMGGNRQQEQQFLKQKGFEVASLHKKYSVNQNILGVTYSGSEIDQIQEPDESMFLWTQLTQPTVEYLTVEFQAGLPVSLNGKKMAGATILQKMNQMVGSHGYGRGYYTGDCVIGIKGHIVFEAPAMLALITAHRALEQLVLTKPQQQMGHDLGQFFTDLTYTGKFFDPAVDNIKQFFDHHQQIVTGTVTLKLVTNQLYPVAIESPYALISPEIATYAQACSWTAAEADGFIKLFGLQGKIAQQVHQKK